jgi:hypothetical protein
MFGSVFIELNIGLYLHLLLPNVPAPTSHSGTRAYAHTHMHSVLKCVPAGIPIPDPAHVPLPDPAHIPVPNPTPTLGPEHARTHTHQRMHVHMHNESGRMTTYHVPRQGDDDANIC